MIMFNGFNMRFFRMNRAIGNFISITIFTETSVNGVLKACTKIDSESIFIHSNYRRAQQVRGTVQTTVNGTIKTKYKNKRASISCYDYFYYDFS